MSIYAKKLSKKWRKCFEEFKDRSGLDPMYQNDIDSGQMTPREAWDMNLSWLRDWTEEICRIEIPIEETT